MGNTIASGDGYSYEVGKNCEKLTEFTSDIVITFKAISIFKIAYNNSKFGKACVAGTQPLGGSIYAENKNFDFRWELLEDEETGDIFVIGNHTKKTDKNSVALFEIMKVDQSVVQANKSKFTTISRKIEKNSELAAQIKKFRK
jgi:hypothetical protein